MSSSSFFAQGSLGQRDDTFRMEPATYPVAGPSTPAYPYSATPMLRMEDAVVETV